MTVISATLVKKLRDRAGCGMMECKKALIATSGDLEMAIDLMRAEGAIKAAKKTSRITTEGVTKLALSENGKHGVLLEINSETDFVTKSDDFKNFTNTLVALALRQNIKNIPTLMKTKIKTNVSVESARETLVAKVGENVSVRRLTAMTIDTGFIGSYQHGERIGVLVNLTKEDEILAKDIAMHIVASNPEYVDKTSVPDVRITREKAIFAEQAKKNSKIENIIEKIVNGKLDKFINEITLYGQKFVKNPDITIATLLKSHNARVISFVRYEVGEGIEKARSDFREEVMIQAQGIT